MPHLKKNAQRGMHMGNGCSQSLAKQEPQVNRSKQMADSEKMEEIDFSHCSGKCRFFSNAKHLHEFKR